MNNSLIIEETIHQMDSLTKYDNFIGLLNFMCLAVDKVVLQQRFGSSRLNFLTMKILSLP